MQRKPTGRGQRATSGSHLTSSSEILAIIQSRVKGSQAVNEDTDLTGLKLTPSDLSSLSTALSKQVNAELDLTGLRGRYTIGELAELVDDLADTEVANAPIRRAPTRTPSKGEGHRASTPTAETRGPAARPPGSVKTTGIEPPKGVHKVPPKTTEKRVVVSSNSIDTSVAKFRRQKSGVGKCTGDRLLKVQEAYGDAYYICGSAKEELDRFAKYPLHKMHALWNEGAVFRQASLGFWFGESVPERDQVKFMLSEIRQTVNSWEIAFREGFWRVNPVFIRCKSVGCVGDALARHLVRNTIEVCPSYFNLSPSQRAITMLHEMGHYALGSATQPRDERHDLCNGGWNRAKNMCYRDKEAIQSPRSIFTAGNPRVLVIAYDQGNTSVRDVMLNNIDNYISFMWNRSVDRGSGILNYVEVDPAAGKPAAPPPKSKPVN